MKTPKLMIYLMSIQQPPTRLIDKTSINLFIQFRCSMKDNLNRQTLSNQVLLKFFLLLKRTQP